MKKLVCLVDTAALIVFLICLYSFLKGNDVFSGKFSNDALGWYFLAKGIYCSICLALLVRVLAVLSRTRG